MNKQQHSYRERFTDGGDTAIILRPLPDGSFEVVNFDDEPNDEAAESDQGDDEAAPTAPQSVMEGN